MICSRVDLPAAGKQVKLLQVVVDTEKVQHIRYYPPGALDKQVCIICQVTAKHQGQETVAKDGATFPALPWQPACLQKAHEQVPGPAERSSPRTRGFRPRRIRGCLCRATGEAPKPRPVKKLVVTRPEKNKLSPGRLSENCPKACVSRRDQSSWGARRKFNSMDRKLQLRIHLPQRIQSLLLSTRNGCRNIGQPAYASVPRKQA